MIIVLSLCFMEGFLEAQNYNRYKLGQLLILDSCINSLIEEKIDSLLLKKSSPENESLLLYIENRNNIYKIKIVTNDNMIFNPLVRNKALGFLEYDIPVFVFYRGKKKLSFFKCIDIIKVFTFFKTETKKIGKNPPPPPPIYDPIVWNYLYTNDELKMESRYP